MQTYLVRARGSKRLVGIFSAMGSDGLFHVVDELADPFECEFLELLPGEGIFVDGQFAQALDDLDEPASPFVVLSDASWSIREPLQASQALASRIDAVEDFGWEAFTMDDAAAIYFFTDMCCKSA